MCHKCDALRQAASDEADKIIAQHEAAFSVPVEVTMSFRELAAIRVVIEEALGDLALEALAIATGQIEADDERRKYISAKGQDLMGVLERVKTLVEEVMPPAMKASVDTARASVAAFSEKLNLEHATH